MGAISTHLRLKGICRSGLLVGRGMALANAGPAAAARLAHAGRSVSVGHEMDIEGRHVAHAGHGKVTKVALLDEAVLEP